MTGTETIKLNQIIGKALCEAAHEALENRIKTMKSRPFDEVVEAIKTYKETRYNKANGYYATDAIKYFDKELEVEHTEVWLEIEDTMDSDWFEAIEIFRW